MTNDRRRRNPAWLSLGLLVALLLGPSTAAASAPEQENGERLQTLARSLVTVLRQEQRALAQRAAALDAREGEARAQGDEAAASQEQLDRLAALRARLDDADPYAVAADRIAVLAAQLDELAPPGIDGSTVEVGLAAAELVVATELRDAPDDSAAVLTMAEAGTVLIVIGAPPDGRWRLVATPKTFGFILTDALAEL